MKSSLILKAIFSSTLLFFGSVEAVPNQPEKRQFDVSVTASIPTASVTTFDSSSLGTPSSSASSSSISSSSISSSSISSSSISSSSISSSSTSYGINTTTITNNQTITNSQTITAITTVTTISGYPVTITLNPSGGAPAQPGNSNPGQNGGAPGPAPTPYTCPSFTTLADESTSVVFAKATIASLQYLTTPTIITTAYLSADAAAYNAKITSGPVFVGPGGVVLLHSPAQLPIVNPIVPPPSPGLKCPKILGFLCGPSYTTTTDNGPDVDPADKA